jgi:hypothetical protein
METKSLFYRLCKMVHLFTPEQEHQALLKCDQNIQFEAFNFLKEFNYVQIPGKENITVAALTLLQLQKFNEISKKTGIMYDIHDITDEAILDELDEAIVNDNVAMNVVVTPYLKCILTVDIVLDKINIKGFDKLSTTDMSVLYTNKVKSR